MRRTPALILGGGPAGAATAIMLARAGRAHLLVERTRETGDALCGGFLSWRSLRTLATLGIDVEALNGREVRALRLVSADATADARLPAPAKGVSRHRLDSALLEEARKSGAAIERGLGARSFDACGVRFEDGSVLAPDALFLATGKHDLRGLARPQSARGSDPSIGLRIRLGPARALDRMIGDTIELHLFDRGYAGLVMQEDGTANLCMAVRRSRLSEAGSPAQLLALIGAESPRLGERLAWRASESPIDAVANIPYGWRAKTGDPAVFRLGDQAGVIASLAGEGMSIAVSSAIMAAQSYLAGGADASIVYQARMAGRLRRPLAVAGTIRNAAERPARAAWLIAAARRAPTLVDFAARLTRIGHWPIDAGTR